MIDSTENDWSTYGTAGSSWMMFVDREGLGDE
jgi:hypothetical protein